MIVLMTEQDASDFFVCSYKNAWWLFAKNKDSRAVIKQLV